MSQPLKIVKFEPVPKGNDKNKNISSDENDSQLKSNLLLPLKIAATVSAIAGVLALVFEVRSMIGHSFEIYLSRLFATIISFTVLVVSQTKTGKKHSEFLVHAFFISILLSFGFISFRLPAQFVLSSQLSVLLIFTLSLFLGWKDSHQIAVVVYYILIFTAVFVIKDLWQSGLVTPENFLPTLFLLILSFFANRLTYKNKVRAFEDFNSLVAELNSPDDELQNGSGKVNELIENSPLGMFQLSTDANLTMVNNSLIDLLEAKSRNELIGKNFAKEFLQNESDIEKVFQILKGKGEVKNFKIQIKSKPGNVFTGKLNLRPVNKSKKNNVCCFGTLEDITEEEERKKELKKELSKLKKERNEANISKNSAEYSSNFKSKFLASMSHEIRTPMNSVLGFLTLIENGLFESEDELKDFARNAKMSAESLLDIINNILDLSKIEAGKMEVDVIEFNLIEEVKKSISIISPLAHEKGLEINLSAMQDIPHKLFGDSTKYRQILVNLLNNAVKFTSEGQIDIVIEILKETDAVMKIQTSVSDTGKGIPENKLKDLFRPFTQIKTATSSSRDGSGLGLMICKEFVNLLGGEISVESEVDKGSKFIFTTVFSLNEKFEIDEAGFSGELDLENNPEYQNLLETVSEEEIKVFKKIKSDSGNRKRLLLVEDNPISQKVELKLLRETGYDVDSVNNGFDAIEAIRSGKFDLVLMDIEMSDMNGLEATKKIRAMEKPVSNIPIIAVTAHSSMKDREKCLAAGMDDYIAKPININFLKMTIDQWLNEERV